MKKRSTKDLKIQQQEKDRAKRRLKHMMTVAMEGASMYEEGAVADMEVEDAGGYKEPNNKYFIAPRLFVVAADGSAKELLCEEQLEYMIRTKAVLGGLAMHDELGDIINN